MRINPFHGALTERSTPSFAALSRICLIARKESNVVRVKMDRQNARRDG
jgi:hypothetical protein